ncbi:MAG: hypothetical protein R3D29_05775 [Nitratireductor sp.]
MSRHTLGERKTLPFVWFSNSIDKGEFANAASDAGVVVALNEVQHPYRTSRLRQPEVQMLPSMW